MDIICGKCGMHFSSIEGAREHSGHCRATSKNEPVHWLPSNNAKLSKAEWDNLMKLVNSNKGEMKTGGSKIPHSTENLEVSDTKNSGIEAKNDTTKEPEIQEAKPEQISYADETAGKNEIRRVTSKRQAPSKVNDSSQTNNKKDYITQPWFLALLLIFIFSIVGVVFSLILGNSSPFFILIGIAIIFSIEHWFYYKTMQRSITYRPYKIFLNLFVLYLLAVTFWSGVKLFSKKLIQDPLAGSILFIAELIILFLIYKVLQKHRKRWPSMKLTIFGLVVVTLILSFAGVEPLNSYKNQFFNSFSSWFSSISQSAVSMPATPPVISNPSQPAIANPKPIVTPPATTPIKVVAPETTKDINISLLEKQVHDLINAERIKNGLNPLNWDATLNKIAKGHSQDMALRNYFSHESPEGLDLSYRYQMGGFLVSIGAGENIFQCNLIKTQWYLNGIPTYADRYTQDDLAKLAVESWMNSSGHRQNILTPYWQVEGIGIAIATNGDIYFTQDFG